MELQANRPGANLECLILASSTPGKMHRTDREIESLPVPVKDFSEGRKDESTRDGWFGENGKPPNLLIRSGVDPRPQCARDQLSAEADAKNGFSICDRFGNKVLLVPEPRQLFLIIHTHRSA